MHVCAGTANLYTHSTLRSCVSRLPRSAIETRLKLSDDLVARAERVPAQLHSKTALATELCYVLSTSNARYVQYNTYV